MLLLTIDPDNNFAHEIVTIDDFEHVYTEMADTKAEVVVVDKNEVTRMVTLKGVRCVGFEKHDKTCPAWVAIEAALANDPRLLYNAMLTALDHE